MTYLGRPVFPFAPDLTRPRHGVLDDFSMASRGVGVATPHASTSRPRRLIRLPFVCHSEAEIAELVAFFDGRMGRARAFALPLFTGDFRLAADAAAGATELVVERVGLASQLAGFAQWGHLALVRIVAGVAVAELHGIAGVAIDGAFERITLTAPLVAALPGRETGCGPAMFARFNDDTLSLDLHSTARSVATISFLECPDIEADIEALEAIYLYRLSRGGEAWHYANRGESLVVAGAEWLAADIAHGEIAGGVEALGGETTLTIATDDPVHPLRAHLLGELSQMRVQIYRSEAAEMELVYQGVVEGIDFRRGGVIEAQLSGALRAGQRELPALLYQRLDNFAAYSEGNGLPEAEWTVDGALVDIGPRWVEAAEFGAMAVAKSDPNWFAFGRVRIGSQVRLCVGQAGDRLHLSAGFGPVSLGAAVSASAGYSRTWSQAREKFTNGARFLGFPWMPASHPNIAPLAAPKPRGGKK